MLESLTSLSGEESLATCQRKSPCVPRRNSRRNYQESLDQLWIISMLVKVFIDNYPG